MSRSRWFFHPIFVFVFSILALALSLFLYIYWYMEVSTGLKALVKRFNIDPAQAFESQTWVVILVLSLLVAIILYGIFIIFVYSQKVFQLYRLQNNFINNFTHELKTPLTSLKLYLETFVKHELPRHDQIRYLEFMIKDVNRLSDNVLRILDLARIESKSYGGEFVQADVGETVRQFFKKNAHIFTSLAISIHDSAAGPVPYRINLPLFDMLLMNIATNALKYNVSDHPSLDIEIAHKGRHILIFFRDNGIGIEKSESKKIFRKFYQVGHADIMTARGSGLGLYLAQTIARMHKGKICMESQSAQGTTFVLKLPYRYKGILKIEKKEKICHDGPHNDPGDHPDGKAHESA